ncbi:MAG: PQQ-binding-like beta-propeller repeat protein [Rhodospirillales bacterium]|nr:PQQ-binding-like beta-propeller repeat protein [Rhodospirillales bacterium]
MRLTPLIAALLLLPLAARAAPPPAADQGHPIKVTPQMRGAGAATAGVVLPTPPPVTGSRARPVPSWGKPLPYPIVIADRRNNRLIEVAPDKRVIWEFTSPELGIYRGNDDVFFAPDGNRLMVNEEDNYDIHIIDYARREIAWSYGVADTRGTAPTMFNFPDDAHLLPDGNVVTADIRNCRIMFIDTQKMNVTDQWGKPGQCRHDPPRALDLPNGVTPTEDGNFLVTEIPGAWISLLTRQGKVLWSLHGPHLHYPSDAYPTRDGQVIAADYTKPGGVVIFDPHTGKVTWEYRVKHGEGMLNHPSLALELPNGDVVLNDDLRNRVLVIDRKTKKIIWQYGVTDRPGHKPGALFYPDGLDIDVFHDWKATLGVKP